MDLILLRHGKAEPHGHILGDPARALVEKGRDQARKAARLLKSAGRLPDIVLNSPLIRARSTAEEFCAEAGIPGPILQHWLAIGMHPDTALAELAAYSDFKTVMVVGHEPDFSSLIQHTLGSPGDTVEVKKGTLVCLRIYPPSRHAVLRFLIPQMLGGEG